MKQKHPKKYITTIRFSIDGGELSPPMTPEEFARVLPLNSDLFILTEKVPQEEIKLTN
jgi:hypothetical protein